MKYLHDRRRAPRGLMKQRKQRFESVALVTLLLGISLIYKLPVIYATLPMKQAYYAVTGLMQSYLLLRFLPIAAPRFPPQFRVLVFSLVFWVLFSSAFHGSLSVQLAVLSVLSMLTWSFVVPFILSRDHLAEKAISKTLALVVAVNALAVVLLPGAFVGGRLRGVFVDIAPMTTALLVSAAFGAPLGNPTRFGGFQLVTLGLQILTRTRSSMAASVLVLGFLVRDLRRRRIMASGAVAMALVGSITLAWLALSISAIGKEDALVFLRLDRPSGQTSHTDSAALLWLTETLPAATQTAFSDRLSNWAFGLDAVKKSPILGNGLGSMFAGGRASHSVTGYRHDYQPHNLFIAAAAHFGVPILLPVTLLFVSALRRSLRTLSLAVPAGALWKTRAAAFSIGSSLLAFFGMEWFMPADLLNVFWWLSLGVLYLPARAHGR